MHNWQFLPYKLESLNWEKTENMLLNRENSSGKDYRLCMAEACTIAIFCHWDCAAKSQAVLCDKTGGGSVQ